MWSDRLLEDVSGVFVCDSHEVIVRFDADSRHLDNNVGMAMMSGYFPCELSEFWCAVRLKELKSQGTWTQNWIGLVDSWTGLWTEIWTDYTTIISNHSLMHITACPGPVHKLRT